MLRPILLTATLLSAMQLAFAAEAGKVIFAAGAATLAQRAAAEGAPVAEGDLLQTGADGFIYVRTIDNGLFILRPNSKARIVAYHVDKANPANTRVKLDLISGVARSKSGDAVKQARQNFRFNTPVAAIGVRGTDFTVFTDSNVTRVTVLSGGVVVSGFENGCSPDGGGPCEGGASRELFAAQRGQLLQVQRGKAVPQVLRASGTAPDDVAPPRTGEPLSLSTDVRDGISVVSAGVNLDAQKNGSLTQITAQVMPPPVAPPPTTPPEITPPVVLPPPVVVAPPVEPPLPERGIVWGRWMPVLNKPLDFDFAKQKAASELLATDGNYALFRTPGKDYVVPEKGNISFSLAGSEAFMYSDYGSTRLVAPASVTDGKLNLDFGRRSFDTQLSVTSAQETFALRSSGTVSSDGRMYGNAANGRAGYMDVQGVLSNDKGGSAAYIFSSQVDKVRSINGGTYWRQ